MNYTISENLLKNKGYKFQKLYAMNYKTYRKKIGGYTIWLWSKGKTIEVNDWYGATDKIIEFYKQNKLLKDPVHKDCLRIQFNPEDGYIQLYDYTEYYNVFESKSWDNWKAKYDNWHNEVYLRYDDMDMLIKEIETLKN